jgi:NitT/TauT family transport system ATP-binding protein
MLSIAPRFAVAPVTAEPEARTQRPFVEITGVSLTYGSDRNRLLALQNFSLRVQKGELAAVVGPSGCGKSTLLKLVSGLRQPTAGGVIVGDREVAGPLKIVGMAFQNAALLPWRSCLDNVMLPFEIVKPYRSRQRADREIHRQRAYSLLKTVGLADVASRRPSQLSGGMRQRVALCRALVHQPELLLLDEPFSALDAFTREELWDVLQALQAQQNITVILVTHDLTEAIYLADTIHVLSSRPGRVIHREVISFARPRRERERYTPAFADKVQLLREKIGRARTGKLP